MPKSPRTEDHVMLSIIPLTAIVPPFPIKSDNKDSFTLTRLPVNRESPGYPSKDTRLDTSQNKRGSMAIPSEGIE